MQSQKNKTHRYIFPSTNQRSQNLPVIYFRSSSTNQRSKLTRYLLPVFFNQSEITKLTRYLLPVFFDQSAMSFCASVQRFLSRDVSDVRFSHNFKQLFSRLVKKSGEIIVNLGKKKNCIGCQIGGKLNELLKWIKKLLWIGKINRINVHTIIHSTARM
jgi:hypothetical protein